MSKRAFRPNACALQPSKPTWTCGAAAHDDRKTFRRAGRRFNGEGLGKFVFASRQAISSLTSRGNQPMFWPAPAGAAKIIRDSRAVGFDLSTRGE
jgi:hypothetical protein